MSVELVVGGLTWTNWDRAHLVADWTSPADAWSCTVLAPTRDQISQLQFGAPVQVLVNGLVALKGRLENKQLTRSAQDGTKLAISGRDLSAPLVDCSPLPGKRTWPNTTLAGVAQTWLTELGVLATLEADPDAHAKRDKIRAQGGETYWRVLSRLCKQLQLMPWMSPAGVLHLTRPDYDSVPVGDLRHDWTDTSDVLEMTYSDQLGQRYSNVQVVGQTRSSGASLFTEASSKVIGKATDIELQALGLNRPLVLQLGAVSGRTEATRRAEWEVGKRAFDARRLSYLVRGAGPTKLQLWEPNQLVNVDDQVAQVSGPFWVAGRTIQFSKREGLRTHLDLREPDLLLPAVAS